MCLCFLGMRQVIFIAARSVVRPALGSVGFPFDCLALVSACLLGVLFVRQSVCRLCDLLASAIPLFARPLGRSRPHLRSQIAAWSPNRSGGHTAIPAPVGSFEPALRSCPSLRFLSTALRLPAPAGSRPARFGSWLPRSDARPICIEKKVYIYIKKYTYIYIYT